MSYTGIAFAIYVMLLIIAKGYMPISKGINIACGTLALFWWLTMPFVGWKLIRIAILTPNFDLSDLHRTVHDHK